MNSEHFTLEQCDRVRILRLTSGDSTNRLSRACVRALTKCIDTLAQSPTPLLLTGNQHFFSAGADLNEIASLGSDAFGFALMGQRLMHLIDEFPAPVCAAVYGYCMGGGLDLALACDYRIAHPHAIFGHRGAALGLITGWGGTQRLPRLVGKAKALELFVAAEKLTAVRALETGLLSEIADDPIQAALQLLKIPGNT